MFYRVLHECSAPNMTEAIATLAATGTVYAPDGDILIMDLPLSCGRPAYWYSTLEEVKCETV